MRTPLHSITAVLDVCARDVIGLAGLGGPGRTHPDDGCERDSVQGRFTSLLDESADVNHSRPGHPAHARIIDELAPDEARILRLLTQRGAQPAVDVRTQRPFGAGERVIAPGITMIGLDAGCADAERVPAYLSNLHRLGLIWFSGEPIAEVDGYQLLEAQPQVVAALTSAKRTRTRLRSIELTALGQSFCAACGLTGVAEDR